MGDKFCLLGFLNSTGDKISKDVIANQTQRRI